jgi:hypothetical protein
MRMSMNHAYKLAKLVLVGVSVSVCVRVKQRRTYRLSLSSSFTTSSCPQHASLSARLSFAEGSTRGSFSSSYKYMDKCMYM